MSGIGYTSKKLSKYNITTNEYSIIVENKTDSISIVYKDGYIYYYNDTLNSSVNGLYKVSASASETDGTKMLECNTKYYAVTFTFIGSDIYFLNYNTSLYGDSHIYKTSLSGETPEKIA